jgi:hypothetical protein
LAVAAKCFIGIVANLWYHTLRFTLLIQALLDRFWHGIDRNLGCTSAAWNPDLLLLTSNTPEIQIVSFFWEDPDCF